MDPEKIPTDTQHEEQAAGIDAQLAHLVNQEDHELSKWRAIKQNFLAFGWCIFAVWTVLLVSFENQASGNIVGIPRFREDFGFYYNGEWTLDAKWQSAFQGGPMAASIFGALLSGQIADWIGRKTLIMITLVFSFAAVTMEFVATTNGLFFGGKFVNGFTTGALASVCVTYIGEITPLVLRGVLTCLTALSYTLGPFTVALIVNSTGTAKTRWAYRAVFCAQYGFAAVSSIFVFFMPESPWWLISRGDDEKALRSLRKLGYRNGEDRRRLAAIKLTLEEIRSETEGVTYLECFRRSNLRRTLISIAPLMIQSLSGITFAASYSTYYMQLAGYSIPASFKLQIVQQVISMVGNVMSWYLIDKIGRRNLTLYGLIILTVILWLIGGLAVDGTPGAIHGTVGMILVYCWWYNVTVGATAYTILTEVATSRLRVKTISIGLAVQSSLNTMWSFTLPYLFNPDKANLGAKVAFIFGGLAILCVIYLWFYQPETAGRSYEELDELFMKHVSARKFSAYKTDAELMGQAAKEGMKN
ncbi:general substrate transporter [Lipomyces doorenjongii]